MPPGRYLIATHLSVPRNICALEGIFTAPPTTPWRNDSPEGAAQLAGSVLLAIEDAAAEAMARLHPAPAECQRAAKALLNLIPSKRTPIRQLPPTPWTISSSLPRADKLPDHRRAADQSLSGRRFGQYATGPSLSSQPLRAPLYRGLFS